MAAAARLDPFSGGATVAGVAVTGEVLPDWGDGFNGQHIRARYV